jgi:hypothetical protein
MRSDNYDSKIPFSVDEQPDESVCDCDWEICLWLWLRDLFTEPQEIKKMLEEGSILQILLLQQESSKWQWTFIGVLSNMMIALKMEISDNDVIYVQ